MGRPTKLTPERQAAICELIRAGNYKEIAALAAGVSEPTLYRWLQLGETAQIGVYREFRESLKKAEADAETELLRTIQRASAMPEHWQAAAWILERSRRKRWGRNDTILVGDADNRISDAARQLIADPEASRLADAVLSRLAGDEPRGVGIPVHIGPLGVSKPPPRA